MAAEAMARGGLRVTVADKMPSVGRKLLMAGKSGLNLTKDEPLERFLEAYDTPELHRIVRAFGPRDVVDFVEKLEQATFTGSTGRVFPKAMKASPLLRAWLARLADLGVETRTRWRWQGFEGTDAQFDTPDGVKHLSTDVTVLAMGGASWSRLGSDGAWVKPLGQPCTSFAPSNVGVRVKWSSYMETHFGAPLKNIRLAAGSLSSRGEVVITRNGLEGGGVYTLSPALRDGQPLVIDLAPDREHLPPRGKESRSQYLRKRLGFDPAKIAICNEWKGDPKTLTVPISGLMPMDQAISTAGGLAWNALTPELMLHSRPGTFAAGEMLDWDAPTGGYLLTACLATGLWAGQAAALFATT